MCNMPDALQIRPILFAAMFMLAGCAAADSDNRGQSGRASTDLPALSCPELAEKRAAEQHEAESARFDDRDGGLFQDSGLSRDFVAIDAAARRHAVEKECERLRSQPADSAVPVTIDQ